MWFVVQGYLCERCDICLGWWLREDDSQQSWYCKDSSGHCAMRSWGSSIDFLPKGLLCEQQSLLQSRVWSVAVIFGLLYSRNWWSVVKAVVLKILSVSKWENWKKNVESFWSTFNSKNYANFEVFLANLYSDLGILLHLYLNQLEKIYANRKSFLFFRIKIIRFILPFWGISGRFIFRFMNSTALYVYRLEIINANRNIVFIFYSILSRFVLQFLRYFWQIFYLESNLYLQLNIVKLENNVQQL